MHVHYNKNSGQSFFRGLFLSFFCPIRSSHTKKKWTFFVANYFSPTPPPTSHSCTLFLGPLLCIWILLIKDASLEHPPLVIVQISSMSRSWCKCMSASSDNRSSEIRHKPEKAKNNSILFFNIPGIKLSGQTAMCISLKKSACEKVLRCKNFGLKQASGLIGGSRPPRPSPWIRHC